MKIVFLEVYEEVYEDDENLVALKISKKKNLIN